MKHFYFLVIPVSYWFILLVVSGGGALISVFLVLIIHECILPPYTYLQVCVQM